MQDKPIEVVLREHTERLMALPGVVGTAQGQSEGRSQGLSLIDIFVHGPDEATTPLDREVEARTDSVTHY